MRFTSEIADNDRSIPCNESTIFLIHVPYSASLPIFFPVLIHPRDQLNQAGFPYMQPYTDIKAEITRADRMPKRWRTESGKREAEIISRCGKPSGNAHATQRCTPIVIPAVEEIARTVIARYLSHSDACNLSSTILVRAYIGIRPNAVVKWFITTFVMRYLSPWNLTLRDIIGWELEWFIYEVDGSLKQLYLSYTYIFLHILIKYSLSKIFITKYSCNSLQFLKNIFNIYVYFKDY